MLFPVALDRYVISPYLIPYDSRKLNEKLWNPLIFGGDHIFNYPRQFTPRKFSADLQFICDINTRGDLVSRFQAELLLFQPIDLS